VSHYEDAEKMLAMADEAALRGQQALQESDDLMVAFLGLATAVSLILGAQVHATLAVADASGIQELEIR
jgi:hypothetical protein